MAVCSDRMKETLPSLLVVVMCVVLSSCQQHPTTTHSQPPPSSLSLSTLPSPIWRLYPTGTGGGVRRFLTRTAYRFCMTIYARVPCPACQHAMRYTRRDDRWTCTYCPMSISAEAGQSAMVQSTPVQEQPPISIDDLNIFQKQGTRVTT